MNDDDEFDWEAAVKAIDVACQERAVSSTFASTSAPAPKPIRQSTLDSFIQRNNHCQVVGNEESNNLGCYCAIDLEAAKTWIYPVNIPLRDYQLSITKTALFANTLVALPTGLGKTLIAAVVMYNYFRWFPEGKIVFAAPSRPLVLQQIEACHNTVGIPQEWAIDLTGQTSPSKRAYLWKAKRVFFVTPQVLEKDIQSGTCLVKHLVCLVIDEAHRASGNYSYCVAVRELMAVPLQFRILALTATPGSKQQAIQKVIDNLQISKLEYRTETDDDVSPYVHNRKLELVKVPMGKDAVEINDMILEAIRPFVTKLTSFGVHLNRDSQTLSPCDLLNTRDKFRQAPPQDLSHLKYGEVEGCFGVLITLYHVRKLLSSHGIRPAFDMLEEKLKQGSFARLMNKNEVIWKTKALMQQSLSHGAPSPKLSKLREILIDHFKTKDSKNSRVIIFSNFRGSVRDIMNSLSSIGESVKATEFIGQSSGKALKGQTQKIQQAVLQKFRAGGYNIIVATSIGEEGLDIMEVDLVICFDSNVSPLRMIQRMGRTGRKHDGRVVVLACEGSELKGYLRKQANSKAVNKHMHNGGMNSFDFHSSPRMIPHICKPEVQFVEFSIEQFVPRGKKVKDDSFDDQAFKNKLSDAETELIAKYFSSSGEYTWKPSLIAFPHFQAFPSRVHNVMHSFKTRMLIGTMQHLQALSFSMDDKVPPCEVQGMTSSYQCVGAESLTRHDISEKDFEAVSGVIASPSAKHHISDSPSQNCPIHFSHFENTYVSVKPSGTVSIAYVPSLPFVKESPLRNSTELLNTVKKNSSLSMTSTGGHCELSMQMNLANPADSNSINNCFTPGSRFCFLNSLQKAVLPGVEEVVLTPSPKRSCINSEVIIVETPASTRRNLPILLVNDSTSDVKDIEMSPRLTNMVEKGVVPESPLAENGNHSYNGRVVSRNSSSKCVNYQSVRSCSREVHSSEISKDSMLHAAKLPSFGLRRQLLSPVHAPFAFGNGLPIKNLGTAKSEDDQICITAGAVGEESASPINGDICTPVQIHTSVNARGNSSGFPVNVEPRTPFVNLTNSCSSDWHLSSGEQPKITQHAPKFRRLRKYGECSKKDSSEIMKDVLTDPVSNIARSTTRANRVNRVRGKRKMETQAKAFIEEEAEVSADAEVSDDEEEDTNNNSTDDSFIDDRINPTVESTQAEAIRRDMMAIYRRSLLSQSPMESPPYCSIGLNLGSMHHIIETDETGSCSSGKISHLAQTPQIGLQPANQSAVKSFSFCNTDLDKNPRVHVPSETCAATREERKLESRKRKLSFHQVGYDPETSLQPQRLFHLEETGESSLQCQPKSNELNGDVFCDDQFYEGLDLDALEAQATKLLKHKSELSMDRKQCDFPNPVTEKGPELSHSPSFDLGI